MPHNNVDIIGGWVVARTGGIERDSQFSPAAFGLKVYNHVVNSNK